MNSNSQSNFTFKDYQDFTATTAKYPNVGNNTDYPLMGLMGEFGELCEKFKKLERDSGSVITPEIKTAIVKEAGDVMWYVARLASELNVELEAFMGVHQYVNVKYVDYLKSAVKYISTIVIDMDMSESKEVVQDNLEILISVLSQLLGAQEINVSLEEVLKTNMEKLIDRKNRNAISGSGDNR